MKKLNIAIIGQGFMGRAHSNAYAQVNHFFETGYEPRLKVICGRNQTGLEKMAATPDAVRSLQLAAEALERATARERAAEVRARALALASPLQS